MEWSQLLIDVCYLIASMCFVMGLRDMSHPETARRGMFLAEAGMFIAVVGTLLHQDIISYTWIIIGLVIGSVIGTMMALRVPMTAMPQRTALSHAFGALAVALVGISEYFKHTELLSSWTTAAIGFEVMLGGITFTGSLLAFAKLHDMMPGSPIVYRGQNICNGILLVLTAGSLGYLIYDPTSVICFSIMAVMAFVFGALLVLPIGAADMPVVMALLNSYAGLAAAATGFVLSNSVLIIAGTLDGGSGFILSIQMCKAMNRSITNVLFGAFGSVSATEAQTASGEQTVKELNFEDVAIQLAYARKVVFVPGYGMATAQAQYVLRELSDSLESRGVGIKFAIHPVAGRMPGHMNVLLAEANVPYSCLHELEQINPDFHSTDVVVVIGANDVVNPDARDNSSSPIYGMPILDVDKAASVVILKRGKGKGFSGIENPLFSKSNSGMLYGDAKTTLMKLVHATQTV